MGVLDGTYGHTVMGQIATRLNEGRRTSFLEAPLVSQVDAE